MIKGEVHALTEEYCREIEKRLKDGCLVELSMYRDGSVKAKTVRKKEIQIPAAR